MANVLHAAPMEPICCDGLSWMLQTFTSAGGLIATDIPSDAKKRQDYFDSVSKVSRTKPEGNLLQTSLHTNEIRGISTAIINDITATRNEYLALISGPFQR